jgi:uncharacterized SAM-binding protein YcdF (DUF218 family)
MIVSSGPEMNSLANATLEAGKAILVPSLMLVTALVIGVALLWSPLYRVGRWVCTIAAIVLLLCAVGPLSAFVARPLETRFPSIQQLPDDTSGIILLGGAFERGLTVDWHQPQLNTHAERITTFLALAQEYPNLQLIFSGGPAAFSSERVTESDIARDLFASLGVSADRIRFENRSRNTCENAIYTKQLVRPLKDQKWVLITSAMDIPRAVGAFRKAGFRVLPYPVDYTAGSKWTFDLALTVGRNLDDFDHAVHEWLGLVAYYLMGCTDHLLPSPEPG